MVRSIAVLAVLLVLAPILAGCAAPAAAPTPVSPKPTAPAVAPAPSPTVAAAPLSPTAAPAASPTARPAATAAPAVAATATPPAAPSFPVTVADDSKRKVTFERAAQRIISLSPGHTETLYALGAGDRVVVTDKYSIYPPENKEKAKLTTYPKPNSEEIVSLKPDLIVVLVEADEFIQQMDAQGIKVLKILPKTFDDVLRGIEILGQVTGAGARASQITAGMRERANTVVARVKDAPRPRVLYELDASDPAKIFVAGPGEFYGNMVPMAGGKNIFDDLGKPFGQVSVEQIVSRDPEIIILGDSQSPYNPQTPEMVKARAGWGQFTAVRANRIHTLDNALLSTPGPRLVDGLEQMAKAIHPDIFR